MILGALDPSIVNQSNHDLSSKLSPIIASVVSLCTIVVICSWCYKCWKGSNEKDDSFSTSSESPSTFSPSYQTLPRSSALQTKINPFQQQRSTKYRSATRQYHPAPTGSPGSSPELGRAGSQYSSPHLGRRTIKFKQPPIHKYELQSPQPNITEIELPEPPPPPVDNTSDELGCLFFSLTYNSNDNILTLRIQKAIGLPAKDLSGTSDPFVKILLLPDKKHKLETRVKRKNLNPVWNELFTFEGFPHDKLLGRTLYLQVLDYDRFSRNDPIGEVEIPLENIELGPMTVNYAKNLQPCKRLQAPLGDLLISLMYQPSANRIVVVVMKAHQLKSMDIIGSSDPYIKIYVLHKDKRIDKKKTTIKKRTTNPVWNESFIIDVPLDKIRDMTFVFNVMDYDRITRNELIGQVILGYRTTGPSLKHWTEMMNNPRKPIAHWHKLQLY